jgi:hypothetical protein
MAIRVRTLKPRDLSHQMGEGIPNHVSPMGSMFVNTLNGDIYHNRLVSDQPEDYGKSNLNLSINDINKETPTGIIDGVNKEFLLNDNPVLNTEYIFLNGVLQEQGGSRDYILVDNKIIFNSSPLNGSVLIVSYKSEKYIEAVLRMDREIPVGIADGFNKEFLLSNRPIESTENIFLNGVLQEFDGMFGYTISDNKINFKEAPEKGSRIIVSYKYIL